MDTDWNLSTKLLVSFNSWRPCRHSVRALPTFLGNLSYLSLSIYLSIFLFKGRQIESWYLVILVTKSARNQTQLTTFEINLQWHKSLKQPFGSAKLWKFVLFVLLPSFHITLLVWNLIIRSFVDKCFALTFWILVCFQLDPAQKDPDLLVKMWLIRNPVFYSSLIVYFITGCMYTFYFFYLFSAFASVFSLSASFFYFYFFSLSLFRSFTLSSKFNFFLSFSLYFVLIRHCISVSLFLLNSSISLPYIMSIIMFVNSKSQWLHPRFSILTFPWGFTIPPPPRLANPPSNSLNLTLINPLLWKDLYHLMTPIEQIF